MSAYAGLLGGAGYGAYFTLGASFGKRGGGRGVFLFLDFIFGSGSGAIAALFPRPHLKNILGGAAPLEMSARASAIVLLVLIALYVGGAANRARR
jgi:hypothetical protein